MAGQNAKKHQLESNFKTNWIKYAEELYPVGHHVVIPATHWRLLPYDCYHYVDGIFRAVELKVDDHTVETHQYKALYDVASNRGYAFVVRWLNTSKSITIENFTLGTSYLVSPVPSDRQLDGTSKLDIDAKPATNKKTVCQALQYIMGFTVSPLEAEIQHIIKANYQNLLSVIARRGRV